MKEVDVRGLSCPEPVMLTLEALENSRGETIKIISDEAHSKKNIEKMLKTKKYVFETKEADGCFEITVKAAKTE